MNPAMPNSATGTVTLGHLRVAAVAHDLGADLDQLLAQLVSDHGSAARGITSVFMKLLADDEFSLTLRDAASAR